MITMGHDFTYQTASTWFTPMDKLIESVSRSTIIKRDRFTSINNKILNNSQIDKPTNDKWMVVDFICSILRLLAIWNHWMMSNIKLLLVIKHHGQLNQTIFSLMEVRITSTGRVTLLHARHWSTWSAREVIYYRVANKWLQFWREKGSVTMVTYRSWKGLWERCNITMQSLVLKNST